MAEKNVKKRNWVMIVYPDSLPENWLDILVQTGLPCAISPLHDRDVEATGDPKKPHRHVIMCWDGPAPYTQAKRISDSLHGAEPKPLDSLRGYYRYLTHKDSPDKAQYDDKDIIQLNGFNIANYTELTRSEVTEALKMIQGYVRAHGILEYADLMDGLMDAELWLEWEVAATHTFFCAEYITSQWRKAKYRAEQEQQEREDVRKAGL